MDPIISISKNIILKITEDASQAHGAKYKGTKVGNFSDIACYSLYPGKNLGALGDGGIITTNNPNYSKTILALRNIGQHEKYYHEIIGYNSRLDTVQAAVLNIKLKYLDQWIYQRQKAASYYSKLLDGLLLLLILLKIIIMYFIAMLSRLIEEISLLIL